MLRNKILKASGGVTPTEIIDFGSAYDSGLEDTSVTLTVPVSYQTGDVLVMFHYAWDEDKGTVEITNVNDQTVNSISPTSYYSATLLSGTSVIGYYYTANSSGSSATVNLNFTAGNFPTEVYCAMYVLRGSSTTHFARARQFWTTGTSEATISYEDGVSAIVGFAAYRESTSNTDVPFTVTSTVGTVDLETAKPIDPSLGEYNAGAVAFNLPYTQTEGSSSLTVTSDDSPTGTTYKSIILFAF